MFKKLCILSQEIFFSENPLFIVKNQHFLMGKFLRSDFYPGKYFSYAIKAFQAVRISRTSPT